METNEIMTNEEVIETAAEIANANSKDLLTFAKGFGLGAVVAGGMIAAGIYIVKPIVAKIKAKKVKEEAAKPEYFEEDLEEEVITESEGETK